MRSVDVHLGKIGVCAMIMFCFFIGVAVGVTAARGCLQQAAALSICWPLGVVGVLHLFNELPWEDDDDDDDFDDSNTF